jgi:uncharacterized protein (TIGR03382 family)
MHCFASVFRGIEMQTCFGSVVATVGLSVVIGVAASSASAGNIVTNGSFETGSFFGWSVPPNIFLPNPGAQIFGINGNGGSSGTFYAALSSTELRFISQVLPTTAGHDYELTFWQRRPSNFPTLFQVRWEGEVIFHSTAALPDGTNWHPFTVQLHANINGSFIEFGQQYFPGYVYLDDISVVPVPAPSAAPLLLLSGVVALTRRRR